MKINANLITEIAVIFIVIAVTIIALAQIDYAGESIGTGDASITLLENFQSPDTNNSDPDGLSDEGVSIYTYAETTWATSNVTDLYGAPLTGQSFWVNDSDGDGQYSTLTFASDTYTSASFYFMMDDNFHSMTNVSLEAADGSVLMRFNISDTEISCHDEEGEIWDEDITSGVWYKISVALNWEGSFTGALYSVGITGLLTSVSDWTSTELGAGAVSYGTCAIFNVSGDVGSATDLYIDNVQLYKDSTGTSASIGNVLTDFMVVAGVLLLAIIVSMLFLVVSTIRKKK